MESKKINQLATELTPSLDDLTIIGDPSTGISKKITLSQMAALFTGTVEEYASLAAFPLVGVADTIYIATDTNILYRWSTSLNAYVELSPNIISSLVFNDSNGFDGTISLVGSTATLTITTTLTSGSVAFGGASGALSQDNSNFYWDNSNKRLGINTNAPTVALDAFGSGIIGRVNGTSTNNAFLGFASNGSNKWSIGNVQSDHRFRIYNEATTSELVSVLQTGEFGIGIANPTTKFHIDGAASALIVNLDANVSIAKSISFRSDNSNRWNIEVSGTESTGNAGMDFFLRSYSDAGALIETPLSIVRSTGVTTIKSLTLTNALSAANGGTGITSYTIGDLIYASGSTTLAKLADVATGNALISGGVGVAPSWGKIDLTTTITGTLPVTNGGTGATTFTAGRVLFGNGTSAINTSASLFWDNTNNRLGIGTTPSYELQVLKNQAAATIISVDNNTGNAAANAQITLHTGGATSGDPYIYFNNEVTAWSIGSDNSDADKFKISQNTTLGTNDYLTITSGGLLSITGVNNVMNIAGTNSVSAYLGWYYNTSTLVGYIGNGSSILSGAASSDFIFRSEGDYVVATGGNNRRLTIASSTGTATFTSNIISVGLNSTTTANGSLSGYIGNTVTAASGTTGYGLAIESEASASTSYALTVRNLAQTNTYLHISTETNRVGFVGLGLTNPSAKLHIIGPNTSNRGQLSIQSSDTNNAARASWYYNTTLQGNIGTTGGDFYIEAINNLSLLGSKVIINSTSGAHTGLGAKTRHYVVGDGSTNAAASHGSMFVAAGTSLADTGISVNQGTSGMTMILIASINTSTGTSTNSAVYIVRFYFDGNNTPTTTYLGGSSDFVTFGKSASNTLTLSGSSSGNKSYAWFVNKYGDS